MADFDYDEFGGSPRFSGAQVQRFCNIAGAVCSIALMAGVAVWGYRLAVRDVSGIPVIRAAEGPMRMAPDNPGGEIADHQGMAINVIAEVGAAEAMPDEIVLAPGPIELTLEDAPGLTAALAPIATLPPAQEVMAITEPPRPIEIARPLAMIDAPADILVPDQPLSTEDAVALALAEALGIDVDAVEDAGTVDVVSDTSGISRSPRPQARPQRLQLTAVETVSAGVISAPEIDPATLTIGTRLVQLGAFDTADLARAEWTKLAERFGDLMTGKSVVVQAAQSGGRTFYRLRAHGFSGEDDARRFCSALLAEDAACIPVAHR